MSERIEQAINVVFYAVLIIILLAGCVYGMDRLGIIQVSFLHPRTPITVKTAGTAGTNLGDYNFNSSEKQITDNSQGAKIGIALKSVIPGTRDGNAELIIKNTGTVRMFPVISFKNKEVFRGAELQPGQALKADLKLGTLKPGEYDLQVMASNLEGGNNFILKPKLIIQ